MARFVRNSVRSAFLAGSVLAIALGIAAPGLTAPPQAPFGDKVSAAILNYNRAAPNVATSGRYDAAAMAELQKLGFATIIELRGPKEEGVAANAAMAKKIGLNFIRIPVTTRAPTEEQVRQFARAVEDNAMYPILVNCVSANRAGAMWALYRAQAGMPAEFAIEEGRTAGLTSREGAARARLGLPALSE